MTKRVNVDQLIVAPRKVEPVKPKLPKEPVEGVNYEVVDYLIWFLENRLEDHEDGFDMQHLEAKDSCGTVRCVLGWAYFLWPEKETPGFESDHEWRLLLLGYKFNCRWYTYLFSANWAFVDNTIEGAVNRLKRYRDRGLPYDYASQVLGIKLD